MNMQEKVLNIFYKTGAIHDGHFVYKSGRHGTQYVDKSAVLAHPSIISRLCFKIAENFQDANIETVIAPAVGAIIMAHLTAEHLAKITCRDIPSTYAEKECSPIPDPEKRGRPCFYSTGRFIIGRDFKKHIIGHNVLVVEDVLNTGSSVKAVVKAVQDIGGNVVGIGALCNRGGITASTAGNVPKLFALASIKMETFTSEECLRHGPCSEHVPINTMFGYGRAFLAQRQKTQSP